MALADKLIKDCLLFEGWLIKDLQKHLTEERSNGII